MNKLCVDDVTDSISPIQGDCGGAIPTSTLQSFRVRPVTRFDATPFIISIHYAKRFPSISYYFGLFDADELIGVVCYGTPASHSLTIGICGKKYKSQVLELNRLVLKYNRKNEASYLVSKSLKLLPKPKIIVSYADTSQNHVGVVYKASNFIYTGLSDKRTEWAMKGSKLHSKTICDSYSLEHRKSNDQFYLIDRPRKHRYIYFLGNKKQKKQYLLDLKYNVKEYPK